jgi:hypothetical protein
MLLTRQDKFGLSQLLALTQWMFIKSEIHEQKHIIIHAVSTEYFNSFSPSSVLLQYEILSIWCF